MKQKQNILFDKITLYKNPRERLRLDEQGIIMSLFCRTSTYDTDMIYFYCLFRVPPHVGVQLIKAALPKEVTHP